MIFIPPPDQPNFRLYQSEQRWWSFNDYAAVVQVLAATGARSVLEFGPGSSTLALVEGGATSIDTCEDSPDWADVYEERLAKRFPDRVRLHLYTWREPLVIPPVQSGRFDLALIDGPLGTPRRPVALEYCLDRCRWVLMPTEEWHTRAWLRPVIADAAARRGCPVEFFETGPLSGAFALVGPTC